MASELEGERITRLLNEAQRHFGRDDFSLTPADAQKVLTRILEQTNAGVWLPDFVGSILKRVSAEAAAEFLEQYRQCAQDIIEGADEMRQLLDAEEE